MGGQKRPSDILELEFWMVGRYHPYAGNQTIDFCPLQNQQMLLTTEPSL